MPCFKPMVMFPPAPPLDGGKAQGRWSFSADSAPPGAVGVEVSCGRCGGCQARRQGDWVERNLWEVQASEGVATFVTGTYSDEHLPDNGGVSITDFQGFMKRLRTRIAPVRIRFFGCLEYGDREDRTKRPHWHALIYGWEPPDAVPIEKSKRGWAQWSSEFLEDVWGKGRVVVGQVTPESIAYVVGYVRDRKYGDAAEAEYGAKAHPRTGEVFKVRAPFSVMSRRPGIGMHWFDQFKDSDARHGTIRSGRSNAEVAMPRAVVRRLLDHIERTEGVEAREAEQLRRQREAMAAKAKQAADNTEARRMVREVVGALRRQSFKRGQGDWSEERISEQLATAARLREREAEAPAMERARCVADARARERQRAREHKRGRSRLGGI